MTNDEARAIAMHQLRLIEEIEGGEKLLAKVLKEYEIGVKEWVKQETRENGHE